MKVDWLSLAIIHTLLGYEADVLGLFIAPYPASSGNSGNDDVRAMLIIGFLVFTGAALLTAMTKFANLKFEKLMIIIDMCALFIAGLFIVIGVGLSADNNASIDPYYGTLECTGALFAWLACLFLLLSLFCGGGGGGQSSGSRTAPSTA